MTKSVQAGHDSSGVRVDVWLWAARFFKTRSLAKQAIEHGRIEIDGAACKASRLVHVGDRVRVTRGEERFEIEISKLAEKRGSASIAQTLYGESGASIAARAAAREQRSAERAGYSAPRGKPDKRARRLIRALGDIETLL